MANLGVWNIVCSVDGVVQANSETPPTVCPINPAHEIGEVTKIGEFLDELILSSPDNTRWRIVVDDSGTLITQEMV